MNTCAPTGGALAFDIFGLYPQHAKFATLPAAAANVVTSSPQISTASVASYFARLYCDWAVYSTGLSLFH